MLLKINWKPNKKEMFNFGLVLFCGCALAAVICFFKHKQTASMLLFSLSGFVFLLSWLAPAAAKPFYWAWMGVGFVMGSVVSRVILILIFFTILTPVGLLMKARRRDFLGLKKKTDPGGSYWTPLQEITDKTYYDHLS